MKLDTVSIFILQVLCLKYVHCLLKFGNTYQETEQPRVLVIGAGVAGLSSARYLLEAGINVTVLEATKYVGGTWRYDPRVGTDEYGLPVHTSMYKHLRTNVPSVIMELPYFPFPPGMISYPPGEKIYDYIKSFARYYGLYQHIQFLHQVVNVTREDNQWHVKHRNAATNESFDDYYDYVLVCTGHYSKPNIPVVKGQDKFKGFVIHSHDYRVPDPYKGRRVLVVGAGPSGMDIGLGVVEVASTVIHSHHSPVTFKTPFPKNWITKPDLQELTEHGAYFKDGSYEEFDDIIYCTGYEYSYPFLDPSTGLSVTPRHVTPLYRHTINIHQPSLMMIGLVYRCCIIAAIDAQARYATAVITGNFTLPSQETMMTDFQDRVNELTLKKRSLQELHSLAYDENEFYANLTLESGIARVPPALVRIREVDTMSKLENLYTYRDYEYMLLDAENFTRVYVSHSTDEPRTPRSESGLTP